MKLTTRLAIFVSILIAAISIISSVQSIAVNRNEKLNTYKNILNKLDMFPKIKLYGIADEMPFITPDVYNKHAIESILHENGYEKSEIDLIID